MPEIAPPSPTQRNRASEQLVPARRYAIAVLSRKPWRSLLADALFRDGDPWVTMDGSPLARAWARSFTEACQASDLALDAGAPSEVRAAPIRLLRARVELYLRWCERVEGGDVWGWWDGWSRHKGGVEMPWHNRNELLARDVRWARPLWTHAPTHDPAKRWWPLPAAPSVPPRVVSGSSQLGAR